MENNKKTYPAAMNDVLLYLNGGDTIGNTNNKTYTLRSFGSRHSEHVEVIPIDWIEGGTSVKKDSNSHGEPIIGKSNSTSGSSNTGSSNTQDSGSNNSANEVSAPLVPPLEETGDSKTSNTNEGDTSSPSHHSSAEIGIDNEIEYEPDSIFDDEDSNNLSTPISDEDETSTPIESINSTPIINPIVNNSITNEVSHPSSPTVPIDNSAGTGVAITQGVQADIIAANNNTTSTGTETNKDNAIISGIPEKPIVNDTNKNPAPNPIIPHTDKTSITESAVCQNDHEPPKKLKSAEPTPVSQTEKARDLLLSKRGHTDNAVLGEFSHTSRRDILENYKNKPASVIVDYDTQGRSVTLDNFKVDAMNISIKREHDGYGNKFDSVRSIDTVRLANGQVVKCNIKDMVGANAESKEFADKHSGMSLPDGKYFFTADRLTKQKDGTYNSEKFANTLRLQTKDSNIPEHIRNDINSKYYLFHATEYKEGYIPEKGNRIWINPWSAGCISSITGGQTTHDDFMNMLTGITPENISITITSKKHVNI